MKYRLYYSHLHTVIAQQCITGNTGGILNLAVVTYSILRQLCTRLSGSVAVLSLEVLEESHEFTNLQEI